MEKNLFWGGAGEEHKSILKNKTLFTTKQISKRDISSY